MFVFMCVVVLLKIVEFSLGVLKYVCVRGVMDVILLGLMEGAWLVTS